MKVLSKGRHRGPDCHSLTAPTPPRSSTARAAQDGGSHVGRSGNTVRLSIRAWMTSPFRTRSVRGQFRILLPTN